LYFFQEKIIYQPYPQDFASCQGFLSAEKTDYNGTRMYFKNNGPKAVVFYHGNAGSACDRSYLADIFENFGYSFIVPEYAGYSNDDTKPSNESVKKDAEHVVGFLSEHDFSEIIVAAESIGTGAGSYHVSLDKPDKLLFISPFSSLLDVAGTKFWFYPLSLMLDNAFVNADLLKNFDGKTMLIHGDKDDIIPIKFGKKLFEKINSKNKEFVIIKGAGHNDIFTFQESYEALYGFLKAGAK